MYYANFGVAVNGFFVFVFLLVTYAWFSVAYCPLAGVLVHSERNVVFVFMTSGLVYTA